eukprot:5857905-Pleurochrysis_carterae.AAC.7
MHLTFAFEEYMHRCAITEPEAARVRCVAGPRMIGRVGLEKSAYIATDYLVSEYFTIYPAVADGYNLSSSPPIYRHTGYGYGYLKSACISLLQVVSGYQYRSPCTIAAEQAYAG